MIFELLTIESTYVFDRGNGMESAVVMYGRTKEGQGVTMRVVGYRPYLFIGIPAVEARALPASYLNRYLENKFKPEGLARLQRRDGIYVDSVRECKRHVIDGYKAPQDLLKVRLFDHRHVRHVADAALMGRDVFHPPACNTCLPYELRFLIDHDITCHAWVEIEDVSLTPLEDFATTPLCFDVSDHHVVRRLPGSETRTDSAPLRVLHFDIEVEGRPGVFPQAEHDPVIQIATIVTEMGKPWYTQATEKVPHPPDNEAPLLYNLIQWRTLDDFDRTPYAMNGKLPDIEVVNDERALLLRWIEIVRELDVDVITGWNSTGFDLPYIIDRCQALQMPCRMGRRMDRFGEATYRRRRDQRVGREKTDVQIAGRCTYDVLLLVRAMPTRLRSYTLKDVATTYVREWDDVMKELRPDTKEDLPFSLITPYWNGDDATRATLARYNLKDTLLIPKLFDLLMIHVNGVEMARVQGVSLQMIESRGTGIRTTFTVSRVARRRKDVKPVIPELKRSERKGKYEGAMVVTMKKGYHNFRLVVLDFASLYPSIMRAYNLCPSTMYIGEESEALLHQRGLDAADERVLKEGPTGVKFVSSEVSYGLFHELEDWLVGARSVAKADLKRETDPFKRNVQDARQQALKIACNSAYGYLGDTNSPIYCPAVASAITKYGRKLLMHTIDVCKQHWPGLECYYGDTDSVFLRFPGDPDLAEAIELGKRACELVNREFPHPVKLEFEKVLWPVLLMAKKRYVGGYWTRVSVVPDMILHKGDETQRRDTCLLAAQTLNRISNALFYERNVEQAMAHARAAIQQLYLSEVPIDDLVITGEYKGKNGATTTVAKKRLERNARDIVHLGQRIPFVIVPDVKGVSVSDRAEDPEHVRKMNGYVDVAYYVEKQMRAPIERYFQYILQRRQICELFEGQHTRKRRRRIPTNSIAHFFASSR